MHQAGKESGKIQLIYLAEFGLNVVADVTEDLTSLQKLNIYTKLPKSIELYSNYVQL